MKKAIFAVLVAACLLVQVNALPTTPPGPDATIAPFIDRRVTYSWYNDPDWVSFTGEVSTVNDELTRLRSAYSGYTFSGSSGAGLTAFEWGYHASQATAIIYSNY
ncbi:hypothetical protein [Paraflavitalea pollutisoli]|uniref:hypothetical protein n=1 Tax=Paraflavitalea pollutisoli TaxID=3034143 RepID=UPI0023EC32BF|nr:hypothetical protein [Paraflavitalea sp. H1-2-19X]